MGISHYYYQLVDRLARVTTSGRRIRELDGLRFLAISCVFVQHTFQAVERRYPDGKVTADLLWRLVRDSRIGVELFFVISGFILASPFAAHYLLGEKPVSLKAYYWRRVTRLEPPYLLSLGICFALLTLYWHRSAASLLPNLLASSLYLHNIIYNSFSAINSVAWSLEIEVQFYILAPLLARLFRIQSKVLRRITLLGGAAIWLQLTKILIHVNPGTPLLLTIIGFLPFFLMGFVLADVYLTDWKQKPRGSRWCDVAALVGWLLLPFWHQQTAYLGRNVLGGSSLPFIFLILCWLSFRSIGVRRFLASSFVMTAGGTCYSIYLLHLPLLQILSKQIPPSLLGSHAGLTGLVYSLVFGVIILALSILYFVFVEKPCMQRDWPQQLFAKLKTRLTKVEIAKA